MYKQGNGIPAEANVEKIRKIPDFEHFQLCFLLFSRILVCFCGIYTRLILIVSTRIELYFNMFILTKVGVALSSIRWHCVTVAVQAKMVLVTVVLADIILWFVWQGGSGC